MSFDIAESMLLSPAMRPITGRHARHIVVACGREALGTPAPRVSALDDRRS
jgi:hypothetical protein